MVSPPFYMLVQDNDVLDCCQSPNALLWTALDPTKNFAVAIGVINEEGQKEVVGTCATFEAKADGTVYYLTSDIDGYMRMVNKAGGPVETIKDRVCFLYKQGYLSDPCNFSKIALVEGKPA
jgi:hypothetical protein